MAKPKIKEYDKDKAKVIFVLLKAFEVIIVLTFIFGFYFLGLIQNFFIRSQIGLFNLFSIENPFTDKVAIWFAGWLLLLNIFVIGLAVCFIGIIIYLIVSWLVKINWKWSKSLSENPEAKIKRIEKEKDKERKKYGYAIGDEITIKENLVVGKKYDDNVKFVRKMNRYKGKMARIKSIDKFDGDCRLDVDNGDFIWSKDMFIKTKGVKK